MAIFPMIVSIYIYIYHFAIIESAIAYKSACSTRSCLFVADALNHRIRTIDPVTQGITTLAGGTSKTVEYRDGYGFDALFNYPIDVALVSYDQVRLGLVVADSFNNRIRLIDVAFANVTTLAGGPASTNSRRDGVGADASFLLPSGLAVSPVSGLVYIVDSMNYMVRTLNPASRNVTTLAGSGGLGYTDGVGSSASFSFSMPTISNMSPTGIAVSLQDTVYVADGNRIRAISRNGTVTTLAGSQVAGFRDGVQALFSYPHGLVVNKKGELVVADTLNERVRYIDVVSGNVSSIQAPPFPTSLTISSIDDSVFVSSESASFIQMLNGSTGGFSTVVAARNDDVILDTPTSVSLLNDSSVAIADAGNNRICITSLANTSIPLQCYGNGVARLEDNGVQSSFNSPQGVAASLQGNIIYVSDTLNHAIRMIDVASSTVSTLAGNPLHDSSNGGFNDGYATAALFSSPIAVAIDPSAPQQLVIADKGNHAIRILSTTTLQVRTLAGNPAKVGYVDGIGMNASFNAPIGLAVSSTGLVFVVDLTSCAIRSVNLTSALVTTITGKACSSQQAIYNPLGISLLSSTVLAITASNRIQLVDISDSQSVTYRTIAGNGMPSFSNGDGASSSFNRPQGLAYSSQLNALVVADTGNGLVRLVATTDGKTETLVGVETMVAKSNLINHPGGIVHADTLVQVNALYVQNLLNLIVHSFRCIDMLGQYCFRVFC